jgi:hypothetical protein
MQKAIATCPHVQWSGLKDAQDHPCRALDTDINDDYYFATVLRGIQPTPPFPTAQVASLFAVESLFPDQAMEMYGRDDDRIVEQQSTVPRIPIPGGGTITNSSFSKDESSSSSLLVPIGFHKPWWYHPNTILLSPTLQQACPYLPFIFTPDMTRVPS